MLLSLHHLITDTQLVAWFIVQIFFWWDGSKRKLCCLLSCISIWILRVYDLRVFGHASEEVRRVFYAHGLAHSNCFWWRSLSNLAFFYRQIECYKLQLFFQFRIILVLLCCKCLKLLSFFAISFSWVDRWEQGVVLLQHSLLLLLYDVVSVIWHRWHLFYRLFL